MRCVDWCVYLGAVDADTPMMNQSPRQDQVRWFPYPRFPLTLGGAALIAVATAAIAARSAPTSLSFALAAGLLVGVCGGHAIAGSIVCWLRARSNIPWKEEEPITSDVVGIIERLIIFGATLLGQAPLAIGGWVALKTVSQWKAWEHDDEGRFGAGRARFHLFLIGTSLSVISAVGGAIFGLWLHSPDRVGEFLSFGLSPPKPGP
jgi:hypothetical protein